MEINSEITPETNEVYKFIRTELTVFICNHKEINLDQKSKGVTYLLIGVYKKQILEYISLNFTLDKIKQEILKDIVERFK